MKQKRFHEIILSFKSNPLKAKRALQDRRLTIAEKTIIQGYLAYRIGKNEEALEFVESIKTNVDPYISAHIDLFKGMLFINLRRFIEARQHLSRAETYFTSHDIDNLAFSCLSNRYIVSLNLKETEAMKIILQEIKKASESDVNRKTLYLIFSFGFFTFLNDREKAEEIMKEIEPLKSKIPGSSLAVYQIQLFNFHASNLNFEQCWRILGEMTKQRSWHLQANYEFMKKLLDHFCNGSSLYVNDKKFKKAPPLFHQIKVIQSMEERNWEAALLHWNWLHQEYPSIYLKDFIYKGEKTIFSLCLEKYCQEIDSKKEKIQVSGNKEEMLEALFKNDQGPFTQQYLCKFLWGTDTPEKEDLVRLSRLIYRIKNRTGFNLKARKGCYHLLDREAS